MLNNHWSSMLVFGPYHWQLLPSTIKQLNAEMLELLRVVFLLPISPPDRIVMVSWATFTISTSWIKVTLRNRFIAS